MARMTADAKARLAAASDSRKYLAESQRRQAFVEATPRILFKPWRFDHADRMTGRPPTGRPELIRAGEVRFIASHPETSAPYVLGQNGLRKLKERTTIEPDMIGLPRERIRAEGSDGRLLKPAAADLRKLDSIDARIAKLRQDREEHLKSMVARARPLTAVEITILGQTVKAIGDARYVRPESAAKKVRLPR